MSPAPEPMSPPSWWVAKDIEAELPPPRGRANRALFHIAEALFTTSEGPPPEARLRWLCLEMSDFLSRVGGKARLLFTVALFLGTWVAPLWLLRLPPLRTLSRPHRIEALDRLEASPIGTPLFALKAIVSLVYYEHPDAAAELGFDGQPLLELRP